MSPNPSSPTPTDAAPAAAGAGWRYGLVYFAAALLGVLLAPVPLAAWLAQRVSNFEGARGYAFIAYVPMVAGALLLLAVALYVWARKRAGRRRGLLTAVAGFDLLAAALLAYVLAGGFGF